MTFKFNRSNSLQNNYHIRFNPLLTNCYTLYLLTIKKIIKDPSPFLIPINLDIFNASNQFSI